MNIKDMKYSNIKNNLNFETLEILTSAIGIYAVTKNKDGHTNEERAILSLFLAMLKCSNKVASAFKSITEAVNISNLKTNYLNEEDYKRIYNLYFKNILYKAYMIACYDYDCTSLEELSVEYINAFIFEGRIFENKLLKNLILSITKDELAFFEYQNRAKLLLDDYIGIDVLSPSYDIDPASAMRIKLIAKELNKRMEMSDQEKSEQTSPVGIIKIIK